MDSVAVAKDGGDEGGNGGLGGEVGGVDCGFAAERFDLLFRGLVAGVALEEVVSGLRGCGRGEGLTWTRRMSAPASARARAIDWPMPRVPPVTRAVWPSSEKSCCTDAMLMCW